MKRTRLRFAVHDERVLDLREPLEVGTVGVSDSRVLVELQIDGLRRPGASRELELPGHPMMHDIALVVFDDEARVAVPIHVPVQRALRALFGEHGRR
jgi:hypothetical protein